MPEAESILEGSSYNLCSDMSYTLRDVVFFLELYIFVMYKKKVVFVLFVFF